MKTQELIRLYLAGETKGKASNTSIQKGINGNTRLFHYNTVLAQFDGGTFIHINTTKYSVSTSKVQTWLRGQAANSHREIIEHDNIRMNTQSLV